MNLLCDLAPFYLQHVNIICACQCITGITFPSCTASCVSVTPITTNDYAWIRSLCHIQAVSHLQWKQIFLSAISHHDTKQFCCSRVVRTDVPIQLYTQRRGPVLMVKPIAMDIGRGIHIGFRDGSTYTKYIF